MIRRKRQLYLCISMLVFFFVAYFCWRVSVVTNVEIIRDSSIGMNYTEVVVVVVNEHHEVIPYWYQAAREGIISNIGNTLVHIDGHSDMAPPEIYEDVDVNEKDTKINLSPLMQANDVFIIAAIAQGLIERVIWVQPTWLNGSRYVKIYKSYVGWTLRKSDGIKTYCTCSRRRFITKKQNSSHECSYLDQQLAEDNQFYEDVAEVKLSTDECHLIRKYSFIVVNEKNMLKYVNMQKIANLFVDIDEDFFGVESGVQNYINKGIPLIVQNNINELMPVLFCPETVIEEQSVESQVHQMLREIAGMKKNGKLIEKVLECADNWVRYLMKEFLCKCNVDFVETKNVFYNFTHIMSEVDVTLINALKEAKYCLRTSPRFKSPPVFNLCTGNISPGETLNQIHVGTSDEILTRGKNLKEILFNIQLTTGIQFVSVCRSLRDGYTPREQQRLIEKTVLTSIQRASEPFRMRSRIIYDEHLVYGEKGWI